MAIDPRALLWIRKIEGDFTDHPADRGGPTYAGITAPACVGLRDDEGGLVFDLDSDGDVDAEDIRQLARIQEPERTRLVAWFYGEVWHAIEALPWPASLLAFDGSVHHGQRPGVVLLQRALDVDADGIIGTRTVRAARLATPKVLTQRVCWQRANLFRKIVNARPSQNVFLRGWLNRAAMLEDAALS